MGRIGGVSARAVESEKAIEKDRRATLPNDVHIDRACDRFSTLMQSLRCI